MSEATVAETSADTQDSIDATDSTETTASSSSTAPTTRVIKDIVYCPNCTLPPEYCEFSACYAEKCKPWLIKNGYNQYLAKEDIVTATANLSLQSKEKDEKKEEKEKEKEKSSKKSVKMKSNKSTEEDEEDEEGEEAGEHEEEEAEEEEEEEEVKPKKSINKKSIGEPTVIIRKEERTKRKFTTSVKGLELFGCDLKKAAKAFSKKFACSASVVKVSDGSQEIQIQGDVLMDLPDFIMQEFKVK